MACSVSGKGDSLFTPNRAKRYIVGGVGKKDKKENKDKISVMGCSESLIVSIARGRENAP